MRIIMAAGGTGGHIYPALAIINKIKEQEKSKVELREEINPDIIGGYILDIDGKRLDASIIRQLSKLYKYAGH